MGTDWWLLNIDSIDLLNSFDVRFNMFQLSKQMEWDCFYSTSFCVQPLPRSGRRPLSKAPTASASTSTPGFGLIWRLDLEAWLDGLNSSQESKVLRYLKLARGASQGGRMWKVRVIWQSANEIPIAGPTQNFTFSDCDGRPLSKDTHGFPEWPPYDKMVYNP